MNRIILISVFTFFTVNVMAQKKIVQTAGRDQLGEFAPKFAELNDDVLFGEVWSRTDKLGLRDRSLVTITSLISHGITDSSLTFHLQSAKKNGITRTEIAEIITHIGFYAGWPKAWAAFRLAKDVWAEDANGEDAKAAFQREMIFPIGEPNTAYAQYFIGNSSANGCIHAIRRTEWQAAKSASTVYRSATRLKTDTGSWLKKWTSIAAWLLSARTWFVSCIIQASTSCQRTVCGLCICARMVSIAGI